MFASRAPAEGRGCGWALDALTGAFAICFRENIGLCCGLERGSFNSIYHLVSGVWNTTFFLVQLGIANCCQWERSNPLTIYLTHIYIYTYTTYTERERYIYIYMCVYTYTLACTRTLLAKTHKQGIGLLICYLDRDTSGRRLRVATASNHLRREGHVERCSRDTKHTARLMSFEFWHKDP